MKKRRSNRGTSDLGIPLTPIIDIVFLLLIYFMLTSNFVEEHYFKVDLPKSAHGTRVERQNIVISISGQGDFFLNKRPIEADQLEMELNQIKKGQKAPTVEIRSDRMAPVHLIVKAMDAAKGAGLKRVLLTTRTK